MGAYDPIQLEIFKNLFASIAEEMGVVLRKSSFSPNIKERRDFSCALFDGDGNMIAQAAHIPVHLGSMPQSVLAAIRDFQNLVPGDTIALNDPFSGGTHLPDITLVTPVFFDDLDARNSNYKGPGRSILGFVANRAHHADVGGITPGSMPVASEIYQEGLIIPPVKLVRAGRVDEDLIKLILANVRTPQERLGDLLAQIAANQRGEKRLIEMADRYGSEILIHYMNELLAYTERMTRNLLRSLPNGEYSFTDYLDDDGFSNEPVQIQVKISIQDEEAVVDFSGSALQQKGCINAVYAITLSAVYYVFRCLLGIDVPNNSGCIKPVKLIAPEGSVVNALPPSAVVGGNVETSQRIVDVLLGALAEIVPKEGIFRIPAASQGTMNNVAIGGIIPWKNQMFTYYETIGGGMGARYDSDGASAVHSHMTNTLNTPIEALEFTYPLRIKRYEIRRISGGEGLFRGGDGIRRDIETLVEAKVTLLTERRLFQPYGLQGGKGGKTGENRLIRNGEEIILPGKGTFTLEPGDVLSVQTPGGGGYGDPETRNEDLNK